MTGITESNGIRIEDVGGMLTDVLRLGPTSKEQIESGNNNFVLMFVVPGNPGTLSFYKDFIIKLHNMATLVFGKQQLAVVTVGAGHANHHFAEDTRDQHPKARAWLSTAEQIKHKEALLNQELKNNKFCKVYLVGHSIGAYICTVLYRDCRLKDRVDSELVLLMPYLRHSGLSPPLRRRLELIHDHDPYFTWLVCIALSVLALLLPVALKRLLIRQYAVLPPDICPTATATQLFTRRMVFNYCYMGVDEIRLVMKNENAMIDILKHAHASSRPLVAPGNTGGSQRQPRQSVAAATRRANTLDASVTVHGLRYAIPQDTMTVTHIRDQYVGQSLCSVLAQMWRLHRGQQPIEEAEEHWRAEVAAGRVELCRRRQRQADPAPLWEQVKASVEVCRGDKVRVTGHRHERAIPHCRPALLSSSSPPSRLLAVPAAASIAASTAGVTASASQFYVFDKPAGVSCCEDPDTVNTLRALASEVLGRRLHLAHRLDQGVTGCIVLASSAKAAAQARRLMRASPASASPSPTPAAGGARDAVPDIAIAESPAAHASSGKHYIARVQGLLPHNLLLPSSEVCPAWSGLRQASRLDNDADWDAEKLWSELDLRPEMTIESVMYYDSFANCSRVVSGEGTGGEDAAVSSTTVVTHLATLSDGTHLLRCQPITGHRHQIRCHLASVGLPIANDTLYGGAMCPVERDTRTQQAYLDDEANTLERSLGQSSSNYREWCPKCQWTSQQLSQTRAPVHVASAEVWLRSWRYFLPQLGVSASSTLPVWALLCIPTSVTAPASPQSESLFMFDVARTRKGGASCSDNGSELMKPTKVLEVVAVTSGPSEERKSFSSSVFMLYTDNDMWAPRADYLFFKKKLVSSGRTTTTTTEDRRVDTTACTATSKEDVGESEGERCEGDKSYNVQYMPGLKHAFPLSAEHTNVVVELLFRHLKFKCIAHAVDANVEQTCDNQALNENV